MRFEQLGYLWQRHHERCERKEAAKDNARRLHGDVSDTVRAKWVDEVE